MLLQSSITGLRIDNLVSRLVDCIHNSKVYEDKEAVKNEQNETKSQKVGS